MSCRAQAIPNEVKHSQSFHVKFENRFATLMDVMNKKMPLQELR
jgi:hypothetical protein